MRSLPPCQLSGLRGPASTPTSISRSSGRSPARGRYTRPISKSRTPSRACCRLAASVARTPPAKRGPQVLQLAAHRIGYAQRTLGFRSLRHLQQCRACQGVRDGLLHAALHHEVPHALLRLALRLRDAVGDRRGQHGGGQLVVTGDARHLLHQVVLLCDVAAPVGDFHLHRAVAADSHAKAQGREDALHVRGVDVHAEHLADACEG